MLWLALHFFQLTIDRQVNYSNNEPHAVVLQEGPGRRIFACNAVALEQGVQLGMALKNAYALVPTLITSTYHEHEQHTHLEQLTLWALGYSSLVSIDEPDVILLEVGSSLALFGGIQALLENVGQRRPPPGEGLVAKTTGTTATSQTLPSSPHLVASRTTAAR